MSKKSEVHMFEVPKAMKWEDLAEAFKPKEPRSFYRPHARVQEFGHIVNPVTGEVTQPPSMTKQSFVAECDINNILAQYKRTGIISHISAKAAEGVFMDLPAELDFQQSLALVDQAKRAFQSLPSKVRTRFDNDPAAFLAFCADPANINEMRELGIANPVAAPKQETPPVSTPKEEKAGDK